MSYQELKNCNPPHDANKYFAHANYCAGPANFPVIIRRYLLSTALGHTGICIKHIEVFGTSQLIKAMNCQRFGLINETNVSKLIMFNSVLAEFFKKTP
jgi:hypothetical protein